MVLPSVEKLQVTLRERRLKRGMTLAGVAKLADCSLAHISAVERGKAQLTTEFLKKIAPVLGISQEEIDVLSSRGEISKSRVEIRTAPVESLRETGEQGAPAVVARMHRSQITEYRKALAWTVGQFSEEQLESLYHGLLDVPARDLELTVKNILIEFLLADRERRRKGTVNKN